MNQTINLKNTYAFSENCRICLVMCKEMVPITTLKESNDMLLILNFFNIQVIADNRYPNKICNLCVMQLKKTIFFKQTCQKSLEILNANILKQNYYKYTENLNKLEINSTSKSNFETYIDNNYINEDLGNKNISEENINYTLDAKENFHSEFLFVNDEKFESNLHPTVPCPVNSDTNSILNDIRETSNSNLIAEKELKDNFQIKEEQQKEDEDEYEDIDNNTLIDETEPSNTETESCELCNKDIPKDKFYNHMKRHRLEKKYKCHLCPGSFKMPCELATHLENRHQISNKDFECKECNKKFYLEVQLNFHMKSHVRRRDRTLVGNQKFLDTFVEQPQQIDENRKKICCLLCNKTVLNLQLHVKCIHNIDLNETELEQYFRNLVHCELCNKYIPKEKFYNHTSRHRLEKKYVCHLCPRSFKRPCELATHLETGHRISKKDFECKECSEKFYLEIQLNSHMKTHLTKKGIITCTICNKKVTGRNFERHKMTHTQREKVYCVHCNRKVFDLKLHMRRRHSTRSSVQPKEKCPAKKCTVCGKFVQNIKSHIQYAHEKVKVHKCDNCNKAFYSNNGLLEHIERKHLGVKKALCAICGKQCPTENDLKVHLITHDENRKFDCHLCNKTYKSKSGLRMHLMVHKGIRNFRCTTCSKRFLFKIQLEHHKLIHTGERPYPCSICGRTFNQKASRRTHMKVHSVCIESKTKSDTNPNINKNS